MAGLTFHVPPEAGPNNILPLLRTMAVEQKRFSSVTALLDFAYERGISNRTEMQIVSVALGLLGKQDSQIFLSEKSEILLHQKQEFQIDLVHYLLYTSWIAEYPTRNSYLWAYRQMVDYLWQMGQIDNLSGRGHQIAEEIYNTSLITYAEVAEYDPSQVSFGSKSILGVRKWLERLYPVVIDEQDNFKRRRFCAPELMLLALGWVGLASQGEIEIDFLLTPLRREAICRLCLLEPNALDAVLDWTLPRYSQVIQPGTSAGTYGRFLRFLKWPEFVDL